MAITPSSKINRRTFVAFAAMATAGAAFALAGCASDGGGTKETTEPTDDKATDAPEGDAADAPADESSAPQGTGANLRFVTGGESGTYYAFGSVIAQHATNNAGLTITAASSGGSQANVQEIEDGTAELGFCQSDVMAYAYEGTNLFDGAPVTCFSTLAALYQEQVQIVTCDPEIKSVADLKGKAVSIGAPGSGVYFNAVDILGVYGITEDDITATYQSFGDSTDALKDGKIDAAFVVAGAPTTSIVDLSTSKTAYLVALDEEHVAQLIEASPYYSKAVIAAGTYDGQDTDIDTVGVDAVVLVADSVDEQDVYAICADIFDNAADLVENHAKYAELSLEKGASVTSVPYHPGAAKYFGEKGIEVATK